MRTTISQLRRIAMHSPDPLLFLPVYVVLYQLGVAGTSLWWCLTMLALAAAQEQPVVQRLLAGGSDLSRRQTFRMVVFLATANGFMYGTGWGPMLPCGLVLATAIHLRMSGPQLWRQGAVWSVVCTTGGQIAIALGWVHTYLPKPLVYGIGVAGVAIAALLIRTIGLAAQEREDARIATQRSEERFRALVQDSGDIIALVRADGTIKYASPSIRTLTGRAPEDVQGYTFEPWTHPDDLDALVKLFYAAQADPGKAHQMELRAEHVDGGYRWVEATLRNLLDSPAVRGYVVNVRDIHDRKTAQERLVHEASHDALTGLANRAAFGRALTCACVAGPTAVLFVDLDGFKQVNDRYGHESGDAMLTAAAAVLLKATPSSAIVGRFGGDEFGVVLAGADATEAACVAQRVLDEMDTPVAIAGQQLRLRASIGVSISGPTSRTAEELLREADLAMYRAKRTGTHQYQLADETLTVS